MCFHSTRQPVRRMSPSCAIPSISASLRLRMLTISENKMMPNINPRQMKQMMQRMGVQQEDIDAEEVIIKTKDKNIVIKNPSVQKINMMGQKSYQISGEETTEDIAAEDASAEKSAPEINDDDIETVAKQANSSKEEAVQALKDTDGNIAEAILLLTAEKEE